MGLLRWYRHHLQNEAARRVIAAHPGRHDRFVARMQSQEWNAGLRKSAAGKRLTRRERTALHAHVMDNYRRT